MMKKPLYRGNVEVLTDKCLSNTLGEKDVQTQFIYRIYFDEIHAIGSKISDRLWGTENAPP